MPAGVTLLIGPEGLRTVVAAHPEVSGHEVVVCPETDVREAVELVVRRRPSIVVVQEDFAHSQRGTALAHRIAIDAQLAHTTVWVVNRDGSLAPRRPPVTPTWLPLDTAGTRRAPRVRIRAGVTVQIDGAAAELVDLSTLGAQVVSPTVLKPNQRVRVILPVELETTRAVGSIAWANFELPRGKAEPQYRAGIAFSVADSEPLLRLCLLEADDPATLSSD